MLLAADRSSRMISVARMSKAPASTEQDREAVVVTPPSPASRSPRGLRAIRGGGAGHESEGAGWGGGLGVGGLWTWRSRKQVRDANQPLPTERRVG
jgi:hypothetical protein